MKKKIKIRVTLSVYHGQFGEKILFLGLESLAVEVIWNKKNINMGDIKKLVFIPISSKISTNLRNIGIF